MSAAVAQKVHGESSVGDEIALLAAHLDAATHRLLTCIRLFDEAGEWHQQGAVSCAHWLTWRIGLDPGAAREKVRVARALGQLPIIDEALRRGTLSYAKVRALTRIATPEKEALLLEIALHTTGAQLERLCRKLRRVSHIDEDGFPLDDRRFVREEPLDSGLVRVTIVLHPDEAALFMKALDDARRPDSPRANDDESTALAAVEGNSEDPPVSAETVPALLNRPDAVVRVAEAYLAHRASLSPSVSRTDLVVHLDRDLLAPDTLAATLDDGSRVSAETFRRLSCDTVVMPLRPSANPAADTSTAYISGSPPAVSTTRTRTISPSLRRALSLRDRTCRFPACPNHLFLHAHHIHHWAHGGDTTASNLVLLCTTHHRLVHEGGVLVTRTATGELAFRERNGRMIEEVPRAWVLPGESEGASAANVAAWAQEAGIEIDVETNLVAWDGEPIAYDEVADAVIVAGERPLACLRR